MYRDHDSILAEFGIGRSALIGSGGQSLVYALDGARILRILKKRGDAETLTRLKAFLAEIDGRAAIATPLIERIDGAGRYTVERRLPGVAMITLLPELRGERRRTAFTRYVAAAEAIGAIEYPDRPYGQILAPAPIRANTWIEYLRRSLDRALMRNGAVIAAEIGAVEDLRAKALALATGLEPLPPKALVHGDYFPGNVLFDGALAVSGLVDFSVYTVVGDRLLDLAVACLTLEMIEECTSADVALVRAALAERHGAPIIPAMRFYRAYLAFSMADPANAAAPYPRLYGWSVEMLRRLANDDLPA